MFWILEKDFQNPWQETYAMNLTSTMDASIQQFAWCFTKPTFETFRVSSGRTTVPDNGFNRGQPR